MSTLQTTYARAPHGNSPLKAAIEDLTGGIRHWQLWFTLGWHDIRQRYRRSVVGPFWLTISMAAMVAGLAYLYVGFFGLPLDQYLPFVATGMIVFNMISSVITEGSLVFISSSRTILQTKVPLSIYVYQMLWRNLLIFAHNMCIYVILLPFLEFHLGWTTLLAIPGLLLVLIVAFWVGVIIGTLSARFRDVPPIVASIMQVAFFLTPIFWTTTALKGREIFLHWNPFYYLLEIVRMPLLGQAPPALMWIAVIGMILVSGTIAVVFFARYRARIAYWV